MNHEIRISHIGGRGDIGRHVCDLPEGELRAVWIHSLVDEAVCTEITERFNMSTFASPRKDNVPGTVVGESHYSKSSLDYYAACSDTREGVEHLFSEHDPVRDLYSRMATSTGYRARPADYDGEHALPTRAIRWSSKRDSTYPLRPHEDISQVFCDRNLGWEIREVATLIAVNVYVAASPSSEHQ